MFQLTATERKTIIAVACIILIGGVIRNCASLSALTYRQEEKAKIIKVNIATAYELQSVPGIGPKTAEAMIYYRAKNGPFKGLSDLQKVKGVGPKKAQVFKDYISFD